MQKVISFYTPLNKCDSFFLLFTILMACNAYFIMHLICILLMNNDVDHFFICLLTIPVFTLVMHLFKPFAYFLLVCLPFDCRVPFARYIFANIFL